MKPQAPSEVDQLQTEAIRLRRGWLVYQIRSGHRLTVVDRRWILVASSPNLDSVPIYERDVLALVESGALIVKAATSK